MDWITQAEDLEGDEDEGEHEKHRKWAVGGEAGRVCVAGGPPKILGTPKSPWTDPPPQPAGLTAEDLMGKRKPRLKWLRHASHSTDTHGNDPSRGSPLP